MVRSRLTALTSIATCFVLTVPAVAGPVTMTTGSGTTEAAATAVAVNLAAHKPASPSRSKSGPDERSGKTQPSPMLGTKIPEPSNFMMLGLGIAGLIAGRWAARRRNKNKAD